MGLLVDKYFGLTWLTGAAVIAASYKGAFMNLVPSSCIGLIVPSASASRVRNAGRARGLHGSLLQMAEWHLAG